MAWTGSIEFYIGEDIPLAWAMTPPTNITGWTLQFSFKKQFEDAAPLFSKTIGAGITITSTTLGTGTIQLNSDDTINLGNGAYVCDVERIDAGSRRVLSMVNVNLMNKATP